MTVFCRSANYITLLVLAFVVAALCLAGDCFAEDSATPHEALRKSYFRLKNIDPDIEDREAWRAVIESFELAHANSSQVSDKFYFDYGSLLQSYGQKTAEADAIQEALEKFELLVSNYPKSSLADDALIKRAELLNLIGTDKEEVVQAYNRVLDQFPNSDMAEVARARLKRPMGFSSSNAFQSAGENGDVDVDKKPKSIKGSLPVIVLDPGHGGEDFGAENNLGLLEKDVVLAIALEAERLITRRGFASVVLTRRKDVFVPLLERVAIANQNNAAVFLSLHNNASPKQNQSGLASYVLDDSSDEASQLLAERENKSAGSPNHEVSDLDFIVSDLVQSSKHPKSLLLAEIMDRSLLATVRPVWPKAHSIGIKKAPFYVLVGAHMPCALLELFFLDHESDGEQLTDPEIRSKIAEGLTRGVEQFLARSHE